MVIFLDLALDLANVSNGVQWKLVRPFWLVKPQRCLSTNVTVSHKLISRPMNIRLQLSHNTIYMRSCAAKRDSASENRDRDTVSGPVKKVAHARLPSAGFRSWSQFLAVSLQVTWVINPAVGCHYLPPSPQLPSQPLKGLLPILLLGEQRHSGCEQFA